MLFAQPGLWLRAFRAARAVAAANTPAAEPLAAPRLQRRRWLEATHSQRRRWLQDSRAASVFRCARRVSSENGGCERDNVAGEARGCTATNIGLPLLSLLFDVQRALVHLATDDFL